MIKNLVFSASGSKIFIHLGFLKYLTENNFIENVDTLIGTSGGAIMALIISLGYKLETITELFLKMDSNKLKKIDSESVLNFFENYGLDDGKNIERALRIILKTKHSSDRITFKELFDLYNKKLVVCAINLQTHEEVYFTHNTYPNLDVVDAVLMSLSIPIMFKPKKFEGDMYVDGGLVCPYPIDYINKDDSIKYEETLGIVISPEYCICKDNVDYDFVFCNKQFNKRVEIDSFEEYLFSVLACGSIRLLKERYEKYKDISVLVINNGNGLIFEVDREMRESLISEGYNFTNEFFIMKNKKIAEENKLKQEESSNEASIDGESSNEASIDGDSSNEVSIDRESNDEESNEVLNDKVLNDTASNDEINE